MRRDIASFVFSSVDESPKIACEPWHLPFQGDLLTRTIQGPQELLIAIRLQPVLVSCRARKGIFSCFNYNTTVSFIQRLQMPTPLLACYAGSIAGITL